MNPTELSPGLESLVNRCRFSREIKLSFRSPNPRHRHQLLGTAPAQKFTGTVSGIASAASVGVLKNRGEYWRIVFEFTGDFAIFSILNQALQVAARRPYQA